MHAHAPASDEDVFSDKWPSVVGSIDFASRPVGSFVSVVQAYTGGN